MKPLSKNILSLITADGIGRVLSFIAVTYLARTLGAEALGIFAIGMAILTYASITSNVGLPMLGTRFTARGENKPHLVKRICSARLLLSTLSFIIAGGLLWMILKDELTRNISLLYLISLFPTALFLEWLFQGLNKMTVLSIGRLLSISIYLIIILSVIREGSPLYFVPLAWIVGITVQSLYLWGAYLKTHTHAKEMKTEPLKLFSLIKKGIPLGIATLISQIIIQFPIIYIGFFDSKQSAGLYNAAFRLVVLLLALDRVFYTVFFPAISRSVKETPDRLNNQFNQILKYVSVGTFYLSTLMILVGKSLLPFLFGPQFRASGLIFQLLMIYFILTVLNSVFTFTLIALEKESIYTKSLAIGALGFFAIMLLPTNLSPSITGPIGLMIFQVTSMFIMVRYLASALSVNLLRVIFLPMICAIFLLAPLFTLSQEHQFFALILAIFTLPIFIIIGGVRRSDLTALKDQFI